MDTYTEIRNKIRAMTGQKTPLLLTGKVESIDADNGTCTVSVGDLKLTDVRLRSVVNNEESKLLITPKTGSYVTLIDLSGELREMEVIGYSEIKAIDIKTSGDININCEGTVTFNGGGNDGLVKIQKLTDRLNDLVWKFNNHQHFVETEGSAAAQTGTTQVTTSQASTFDKGYYEDTNIRH